MTARTFFREEREAALLVIDAARECGTSREHLDLCGVCGLHFPECEEDRVWRDDTPPMTRETSEPGCAGARVRQALARYDEARRVETG